MQQTFPSQECYTRLAMPRNAAFDDFFAVTWKKILSVVCVAGAGWEAVDFPSDLLSGRRRRALAAVVGRRFGVDWENLKTELREVIAIVF